MNTGITTTLDLNLQQAVEAALESAEKPGAVVVTRCGTGEIVAAASTPKFNPLKIQDYMESDGGELINKVTQGEYPPGSVFKIVVTSAALEKGISPDKEFTCNGKENINGSIVRCDTGGENGHGKITLTEAFAESCNCAFIQLAQSTGASEILEMARNMGLGQLTIDGYPEEKAGNLMTEENSGGAAIANLAIGQGETLATPLQIARMTGIIANGGADVGIKIVLDDENEPVQIISENTSGIISEMMKITAQKGTGKDLETDIPVAVKTGSAESVQSGVEVVHGWITGFVPAEEPEFVITVFIEDGKSGRNSAGPVFADIVRTLNDLEMIEYETSF